MKLPLKHKIDVNKVELELDLVFLRSQYYLVIPVTIVKLAHPLFHVSPREIVLFSQLETKQDEEQVLNQLLNKIEHEVNTDILPNVNYLSEKEIAGAFLNIVTKNASLSKRIVRKLHYTTTTQKSYKQV